MKSDAMKACVELLKNNPQVSDYKVNVCSQESFQLFFVKGKLETVRSAHNCDRQVTVYADHDGFRGDAMFYVYPSTTERELEDKVSEAVRNALLINNKPYVLPGDAQQDTVLESNLGREPMPVLAQKIAEAVFASNTLEGGSLNSVEVFVNRYEQTVANSRNLCKTQHRYSAMVEAIPTFNGSKESVELYEQYNFSAYSQEALIREISGKMDAVKARYQAVKPDFSMNCPVVLHKLELNDLFSAIAGDLNYVTVYSHGNLLKKGDRLQKEIHGDPITLTMKGSAEGNVASSAFDGDGLSLGEAVLVQDGLVKNYYGSNRFGQYLQENPTGNLGCLCVSSGSFTPESLSGKPWLEVISMSGLQVDFFNDYIGGEIRLAYYHDGKAMTPVTGISVSGKLQQVLDHLSLSRETSVYDGYMGPESAMLPDLKIF